MGCAETVEPVKPTASWAVARMRSQAVGVLGTSQEYKPEFETPLATASQVAPLFNEYSISTSVTFPLSDANQLTFVLERPVRMAPFVGESNVMTGGVRSVVVKVPEKPAAEFSAASRAMTRIWPAFVPRNGGSQA